MTTLDKIYQKNIVNKFNIRGIPSIAARHTSLEYGDIQLDCGFVTRERGKRIKILLITHFHADHGSDIENCIITDTLRRLVIFCPSYCAKLLFNKIKLSLSIQKGREYLDDEVNKYVRIIGCDREYMNENREHMDENREHMSDNKKDMTNNREYIEYIKFGEKVYVNDRVIEPFKCYHTVDTCGYAIYKIRKEIPSVVSIKKDTLSDVNFTEDQKVKDIIINDDREFNMRHGDKIRIDIITTPKTKGFVLKTRRVVFIDDFLKEKDKMTKEDYDFMRKYKINIEDDVLIPDVMFFGDTCSYIFNKKNQTYEHMDKLMSMMNLVIIECTYLEERQDMSDEKYKKRKENRHLFLFELADIFLKYPQVKFLLIHFSASYNREKIIKCIDQYHKKYGNVYAFI